MTCPTCNQTIRRNEKTDTFRDETFHEDPRNCVKATARRCMDIAEVGFHIGRGATESKIRKEFLRKKP